ncbi:TetR family transcriptional regulator [Paenarthrobacter sp. S56]|uniref:TetR/AcrR family transcriptional regulator n=1 Tax=Paenarthrobacter sp. S56 TaxID=3138179 RepID=UPI00321C26C3
MSGAVDVRTTREIARAAVRAELGRVALELFARDGFENVTVDDVARVAGVSRSTFLRYFRTKEDAGLSAFEARGSRVADALRARPPREDDWTALRRALDVAVEPYQQDPVAALRMTRLVMDTPALCARQREKQHGWLPALAQALAERRHIAQPPPLALSVKAAAALDCLGVALDYWTDSGGQLDLVAVLDEAFSALSPQ